MTTDTPRPLERGETVWTDHGLGTVRQVLRGLVWVEVKDRVVCLARKYVYRVSVKREKTG